MPLIPLNPPATRHPIRVVIVLVVMMTCYTLTNIIWSKGNLPRVLNSKQQRDVRCTPTTNSSPRYTWKLQITTHARYTWNGVWCMVYGVWCMVYIIHRWYCCSLLPLRHLRLFYTPMLLFTSFMFPLGRYRVPVWQKFSVNTRTTKIFVCYVPKCAYPDLLMRAEPVLQPLTLLHLVR